MTSKRHVEPKFFEYRIRYLVTPSVISNYHYYMALNAKQALSFHRQMMIKKGWDLDTISIEKKNPYSVKWEDRSELLKTAKQ